jgi:FAD/FMN-containing dehydrogenase
MMIEYPKNNEEVQTLIWRARHENSKISIVGSGYSMGGQNYYNEGIQINTKYLCAIRGINIDLENPTITIEAGCKWNDIIKFLSPQGYSVECMQSYCDFSVGGSISVNCHGQDIKYNPVISSIVSIELCDSSGNIINITPDDELFYYVVGGYGLFGIILSATIFITKDVNICSEVHVIDTINYENNLFSYLRDNSVTFHSARLDITNFSRCVVINYLNLYSDPLSNLTESNKSITEGIFIACVSKFQKAKQYKTVLEEKHFEYTTRNKFLSATINSLKTPFYNTGLFILQEYFIPISSEADTDIALARLYTFIMELEQIIRRHYVNLINVSLRYVKSNPSPLSYSPFDSVAVVLYIDLDKNKLINDVVVWTREIIDLAIRNHGTYYLPYHIFATNQQFTQAYPSYNQFIQTKNNYDPANIFQSHLWQFISASIDN